MERTFYRKWWIYFFFHLQEEHQRQPLLDPSNIGGGSSLTQDSSSEEELGENSSGYIRRKSRRPGHVSISVEDDDIQQQGNGSNIELDKIPSEPLKTLLAFIFLVCAWVATTTSLALTHERVPIVKPLPDLFLDNVQYQSWGLDASEIIIMVASLVTFILAVFHQHR